jgi:hypothetical protein
MVAGGPGASAKFSSMRRHRLIGFCLAGLTVLAVAGCGSSTKVVTDTTAGSQSASSASGTTGPTGGSATERTTGGATSVTSAAGPPTVRCTASRLVLSFLGQQGATGHGELGFALRNAGAVACHTFGFPGVLFLSSTGAPLPTAAQRVTRDFFGSAPATRLVLAPGQRASFRLGVTHGQASSAGCVTAAALQVIPPDDTHTLRVTIPHGAYECGTATVSPLRPGTTALG